VPPFYGQVTGVVAPPAPVLERERKMFFAPGGIPAKYAKPVQVRVFLFSVFVFVAVTKPALFCLFAAIGFATFSHKPGLKKIPGVG
jgi:hypothetical protein